MSEYPSKLTERQRILRVERAAKVLDELYPGWADRVETHFDLLDSQRCIGHAAVDHLDEGGTAWLHVSRRVSEQGVDTFNDSIFADNFHFHHGWVIAVNKRRDLTLDRVSEELGHETG